MAGYTRQDTSGDIANGNVINADDINAEINTIDAAFNASTGHTHDGTLGNGSPITKVGPSQDVVVSGTSVLPKTTNTLDLGSSGVQFKDAFFDGTVDTDALTVSGNATVGGTLGVTGVLTATGGVSGAVTGNVTGNVTGTVSDVSNHDTDDISEGSTNLYFTTQRARNSISATGSLGYNSSTGVMSFTQGNTDTIAEGSTNLYYTDTRAKAAISVTDSGGDGSLTYSAGAITYTGPSASETRAHFSGGTGVSITNGAVAIGQAVATNSDVTFNNAVISGNLTVSGTTTTTNSNDVNISDSIITLNSDETGTPSQDAGIAIERGTSANKSFIWDESLNRWSTDGSPLQVASNVYANNYYPSSGSTVNVKADTLSISNGAGIGYPFYKLDIDVLSTGIIFDTTGSDAETITMKSSNFTVDASNDIYLDAGGGDIYLKDGGVTRGSIGVDTASTLKFRVGTTEEMRLTTSGVSVANGLYVGSSSGTPTDNDIYAAGDIEADRDITAGRDLISGRDLRMTAGTDDWRFEIDAGAANELIISYGGVGKMKLDTSGNLTVIGTVTANGTI